MRTAARTVGHAHGARPTTIQADTSGQAGLSRSVVEGREVAEVLEPRGERLGEDPLNDRGLGPWLPGTACSGETRTTGVSIRVCCRCRGTEAETDPSRGYGSDHSSPHHWWNSFLREVPSVDFDARPRRLGRHWSIGVAVAHWHRKPGVSARMCNLATVRSCRGARGSAEVRIGPHDPWPPPPVTAVMQTVSGSLAGPYVRSLVERRIEPFTCRSIRESPPPDGSEIEPCGETASIHRLSTAMNPCRVAASAPTHIGLQPRQLLGRSPLRQVGLAGLGALTTLAATTRRLARATTSRFGRRR